MLIIHPTIDKKLKVKHDIQDPKNTVKQLFGNLNGLLLIDSREKNLVNDDEAGYIPTEWFIAKLNGQQYKVVFIRKGNDVILKTAYISDKKCIKLYKKFAKIKGFDPCNLRADLLNMIKDKEDEQC